MTNKYVSFGLFIFALWLGVVSCAWAISQDEARHLLARTGFGGGLEQIRSLQTLDYDEAVEQLLSQQEVEAMTSPPDWVNQLPPHPRVRKSMNEDERRDLRKKLHGWSLELKQWWYEEMLSTESELTERMTLFWSNHFTSGLREVKWPPLIYKQNVLLRSHVLGNFREMLRDVSRDPAMLLYLDNARNKKGKPNENFARELLELFTLGEGHYSETDIKEAARALTGWTLNRRTGEFRVARRIHDDGNKIFLGQSGNYDGDDILNIILQQPQVAIHITEKFWREFISLQPDPDEVQRLASIFRESNYEIKPLLRAILLSKSFRATENRGALIKSPVELLVGTARTLNLPIQDTRILVRAGRGLGQDIFSPPNVKGWPGGKAWINSNTLLVRQQIVQRVARGKEMFGRSMNLGNKNTRMPVLPNDPHILQLLLLPLDPIMPVDMADNNVLGQLLKDPVYQLK